MGADVKISKAEVYQMIAVLLNENNLQIDANTAFEDIEGWDSMGTLLLMAELDERFGITLKEEQIKGLQKVSDLLAIIDGHGNLID